MLPGPLPRHGDIAWLPRTYDVGRRDANDGDRSENAEVRVGQYSCAAVWLERIMAHSPNKSGSGEERLMKKWGTAAVFAAALFAAVGTATADPADPGGTYDVVFDHGD